MIIQDLPVATIVLNIGKWKGEDGYVTLEDCGVKINKDGYTIDHEKITRINAEMNGYAS